MGCVGQSGASVMKLGLFSPRLSLLSNMWNDQNLVNIFRRLCTSSTSSSCLYQPMHQTPPSEPQVLDTCSWQTHSYVSSLICLHPYNCNYWRHVKTPEMTCCWSFSIFAFTFGSFLILLLTFTYSFEYSLIHCHLPHSKLGVFASIAASISMPWMCAMTLWCEGSLLITAFGGLQAFWLNHALIHWYGHE